MRGTSDVGIFDRLARVYDLVMPRAREETLVAGLEHADREVERVVDLGGGTGRAARAIRPPEPIVLDAAHGMLALAREYGFATVQSDATRIPLRTATVDAVVVVDALHHMPDVRDVLEEAARVLAPGGVLVIREFDPTTVLGRLLAWGEAVFGFDSLFVPPDELATLVERAGLDAAVIDRGFGYTVVGVKRDTQEG